MRPQSHSHNNTASERKKEIEDREDAPRGARAKASDRMEDESHSHHAHGKLGASMQRSAIARNYLYWDDTRVLVMPAIPVSCVCVCALNLVRAMATSLRCVEGEGERQ